MTEPASTVPVMGTVHHLDDHRPTTPPAEPVNLVKDPTAEPTSTPPKVVPQGSRVVRTARALRTAATHERTRTAGRFTVRHGMYVVGGGRIVARRAWEGRTAARYERMLRAAEAAGNLDLATEWEERGQRFRAARHQRRMDLLSAPVKAAKGAAAGLGITAGGLLLLGIILAVANENFADLATPTLALIELIRWIVLIITVVWGPLVILGPWAALLALWGVGRHQQAAPQWALPVRDRDGQGTPITPSIVVTAMRDLGVSTLRKAIKEMGDVGAQMLSPITIAGCGVEVDVHLPSGVSTEEIQNRRKKLAENLNRHEHEVFITIPPAPRTVRLWIADSGALDEPIGPSPLVTDPDIRADYKSGRAPWGQDLRGDAALVSLFQRMLLITGLSNQGKTASLRALALWLSFDPKVEFRIGDLKGIGDWAMFDGLATVLIQGPTDDHVLDVTEMVEEAAREMNRRLLAPGKEFHPLVVIVDEAQVAYGSGAVDENKIPLGGAKSTSRYFRAIKAIHDQGRAVNVTTWEGTQDPTNENLPKRSREGNHIRSSLVLGTESQARMAVGDAAIDGGAAPHKLRQGLDKGTVVVAGDGIKLSPGQTSVTVRTHYIDGDQAAEIADRAKALRDGVTTVAAVDHTPERDEVADILTVLGDAPRLLTQDVLKRLAVLSKDVYGSWSFIDLKRALDGTGAEPYKSDGRMTIARDRLARHLDNRDTDGSTSAAE
ncbi:ATP-binding protein [Streptomyces sp. McG3]|uniref:ATP-binding protein n=1 Tax=Streptomyces sp. McG3 TaxID=2725483 RepID=UPI002036BC5C|nr:ATP-binding protein [Streptomyces sp. McG3]MBT2895634.1 ATP-binding protein [Streptomyces sp. McG3]